MLPALVFAQRTVSGVVNSTEGPLIGVNIQVKGTTLGAISGIDGDYTLEVANANDTLVFSYVGYVTKEEPLAGRTTVNVDLELESELLNEVVVVGYGVTRKSDLTGSVARVESGDIAKIPTASLSQALQGKVSGVQVTPASGEPGADAIIRVRGVGSFRGADPLFVVDGMIVNDITAIILLAPLLMPLMKAIGVDPVHFAAIMGVNTALGGITPPYASILYMGARIGNARVVEVVGPALRLLLLGFLPTVLLTTYWPELALFFPRLFGY